MQDLNYSIYLLEPNGNWAQLETENIDFSTTYALSDISDVSAKKDNISKGITLKGTKTNNWIFGNVFNQSRFVDSTIDETLLLIFLLTGR